MNLDAVVLAGGNSTRMGEDKATADVAGRSLLARALDAAAGCRRIVVVGPARPGLGEVVDEWVQEDPPGAGPVHALAAGLARLSAPHVLVLACDLPFVTAATVARLAEAGADGDGAVVTDGDEDNPMCAVYRSAALRDALARLGGTRGAPMKSVLRLLDVVRVPDPGAAYDCDTPAELDAARQEMSRSTRSMY